MTVSSEERENNSKVKSFYFFLKVFTTVISIMVPILFYIVFIQNWNIATSFFSYFECYSVLYPTIASSVNSLFFNPTIQSISILIITGIAIFYALLNIRDHGHRFYESEDAEGKYFKSAVLLLALIVILFFPYLWYLWESKKIIELMIVIGVLLFNSIIVKSLLQDYSKIILNYDNLSKFKKSLTMTKNNFLIVAFRFRNEVANLIIILMLFTAICGFWEKFNLISILFIEVSLFIQYFVYCSVTRLPEGPLTIFLQHSQTIFNDAYISEDSKQGYVYIVMRNETPKKIMKSSILYYQPYISPIPDSSHESSDIVENEEDKQIK